MTEREANLYVQLSNFKAVYYKTARFIRWALLQVERPYLACSFGKDSSVMLHMVLKECPDIPVKFLAKVETPLIDDYAGVIAWWKEHCDIHLEYIEYTGWLEGGTNTGIKNNISDAGHDAFFVGLRKEESVARRITLKTHGKFHRQASGLTRIAPLADWSTKDIAAYMLSNHLPVLKAYQREGFEARTTSNIPSKFPHEALARLKDADISAYNELLQLLPNARFFT